MRKIRVLFPLWLLVTMTAVPVWTGYGASHSAGREGESALSVYAGLGGTFRTVDLTVTLNDNKPFPRLYYLALAQGSPKPSEDDITGYAEGRCTDGLTDGTAVRGRWIASTRYNDTTFSLAGAENVSRLPGETGFIDGYRYDIYVMAIHEDGTRTPVAMAANVMAQPFDAMSADHKTFTIRALKETDIAIRYPDLSAGHALNNAGYARTARQLENIQRLADLFIETKGTHGSLDFLTSADYTYVLDSDMDLRGYTNGADTQMLRQSWTPLGNVDANPKFIFRGSFDGKNHTIRHLYLDKDARKGQPCETQGLFGRLEGATIRRLTLENAVMRVTGSFGRRIFAAGLLAGETAGGTIDHITVSRASVTAYGSDAGCGDVGGVVGRAADTHMYDINAHHITVTAYEPETGEFYARAAGGIVGRYTASLENRLLRNWKVSGEIKLPAQVEQAARYDGEKFPCAGGAVGIMEVSGLPRKVVHAEKWDTACTVTGGNYTGGLAGLVNVCLEDSAGPADSVTFDACRFTGRVTGAGYTGGLFGAASSPQGKSILIKNAVSGGYAGGTEKAGATSAVGGLAGLLSGCTVEQSRSRGPAVTAKAGAAGGFVGEAIDTYFYRCNAQRDVNGVHDAGGFVGLAVRSDFQTCRVEAEQVRALQDAGGFAGRVENSGQLLACASTASVWGRERIGGFVGAARGQALTANMRHHVVVDRCEASGSVTASGGKAGGFAGTLAYTSVGRSSASGDVRANAREAGGFCGRLANMSRVENAYATGEVLNTDAVTGGFAGLITNMSCVEYAYAAGNVTGYDDTGGFAGVVSAYGAPNTLTNCLSFSRWVTGPENGNIRRFAGRLDHEGINACYAYMGSVVAAGRLLNPVLPNAYGADGADLNGPNEREILTRLGWDAPIWDYDAALGRPVLASLTNGTP